MTAGPVCGFPQTRSIPLSISIPDGGSSRIPDALKKIFLQAAMDEEILEAPADGSAFKMFERPGIDRPYYNPKTEMKPTTRNGRSSRPKLQNHEEQQSSSFAAVAAAPVRKERKKLGVPGSNPRRSLSPPKEIVTTERPVCRQSNTERPARRQSTIGGLFNRSNHGKDDLDSNSNDNKSFFSRSKHGKDDLDRQPRSLMGNLLGRSTHGSSNKRDTPKKKTDELKGSSHMSSIVDQEKQKRSVELGLSSVHGSSEKTPEATETDSSSSGSEAKDKQVRKREIKVTKSADNLSAVREALQQSGPEDDPMENTSTHSNKSLGGLAAYPTQRSPQLFLDVMLRTRGYSTETFYTMATAYFNAPTELQMASYHARLQDMIRTQNVRKLREILQCGISPNPCNMHGESLLHTACRNGYDASVKCMLEDCGASVQVSDDCGCTPLHSAFFGTTPSYEIVQRLVKRDRHLLHLKDRHGATPLSYIPRDHWGMWIDFFYSNRDEFWPRRYKRIDGVAAPGEKMTQCPNTIPLPTPSNALPKQIAVMVASGKLQPEEAMYLMEGDDDDDTSDQGDSTCCSDSVYSESLSCYGDSAHSCNTWNLDATSASSATMFTARSKLVREGPAETIEHKNNTDDDGDNQDGFDDDCSVATDISGDSFA